MKISLKIVSRGSNWLWTWIRVILWWVSSSLRWHHNGRDSVSNHQPHDCLLNRLFRCRSKKTSKLRVTDLCAGNSPGTGEFPAQMASNAENVSIWWCHHANLLLMITLHWGLYQWLNTLRPRQDGRHFGRRHFQMQFCLWKCRNFTELCSQGSELQ